MNSEAGFEVGEEAGARHDLLEGLDLDFDEAMLSFHEADPQGFYGERSRWFAQLKKPLDPARSERWLDDLPESSVRVVEGICGPLAQELGYEMTRDDRSAASGTALVGRVLGWSSIAAERLVFHALPTGARSTLINLYRRSSGRV